jgi:hypothetical protein
MRVQRPMSVTAARGIGTRLGHHRARYSHLRP